MNEPGMLIGLVSVVLLFGIPLVAVICHYSYEGWKAWLEIGLKRDMVARGYTAEEIRAVLGTAKPPHSSIQLPNVPPAKPIKTQEFAS
jgi:hypothetical protein